MRKQLHNNVNPARIAMGWIFIFVLALMPGKSWGQEKPDEPPTNEVSNTEELQAALEYGYAKITIKESFTISGTVSISYAVQIESATLKCNPERNFPLFSIGSGGALTLNGVHITGEDGTQNAFSFVVDSGGSLVLNGCEITKAGNVSLSGQMIMSGSVISGNNMVNVCAGVLVNGGALTITNSRIEGNTTTLTDYKAVHTMEAGVTVKGGSVALSGEVCVSDNTVSALFPNLEEPVLMSTSGIFLSKGKTLDISSMSGNSRCAVSLEEGHNGVFATGTEIHLKYFTDVYGDVTKNNKVTLENGSLKMLPMDWHDYFWHFAKFSESDLEISDRTYTVKTAKGLAWAAWLEKIMVERSLYSGNPPFINIKLKDDLDLKAGAEAVGLVNTSWMPFVKLYGNLDGEGHTLSNVVMKDPEDWVILGGTGFISNLDGTVSNLSLTGLELEIHNSGMGGFGGIVGSVTSGGIENSSCTGKILIDIQNYTAPICIGGIAGAFFSRSNIKSCWSDVDVVATHSGGIFAGGILGKSLSSQYSSGISNCYSAGSITATTSGVDAECSLGGIVGSGKDITVKSSYSVTQLYVEALNGTPVISIGGIAGLIEKVNSSSQNGGISIESCLAINEGKVDNENAALYAKISSAGVLNIHRIAGMNEGGELKDNYALNKLFMKSEAGSTKTTHTPSEVFLTGRDGAVWTHQLTVAPFKDWDKACWSVSTSGERHLPLLQATGSLLPNQTERTFPNPSGLIGFHFNVGDGGTDTIPNFAEADTIYRILLPNTTSLPVVIALTGTNDDGTDKDVINIQMTDSTVTEVFELVISNGETKKFKVIFTIAPAELPSKPILPDLPSTAEDAPSHPVASIPDKDALPEGIDVAKVNLVSIPAKPSGEQQAVIDKALADKGLASENVLIMDISLMVKDGDIHTAIEPVKGKSIDILIPYPAGTDMNDTFTFIHLLSDNTVEELTPENTPAGLKFRVSSFSLFTLVYTKADDSNPNPPYIPPVVTYYTVTLPSVEGVTLSRKAGDYTVEEGYSFSFGLTLDEGYGASVPVVKANGVEITPRESDGKYVIRNIEEDIQVTIEGIVKDDPTANAVIDGGNRIYAVRNIVYIESPVKAEAQVVSIGGRVIRQLHLQPGTNRVEDLQAGVYVIRLSDGRNEKVSVR